MGLQRVIRGYKGLLGVTGSYKGLQRVRRGYRGLQGVAKGYKGLQGGRKGYRVLQGVTGCYKGLQGVTTFTNWGCLVKETAIYSTCCVNYRAPYSEKIYMCKSRS